MHLENLVFDALEPQLLGAFWESVVGADRLTDESDIVETRWTVDGDYWLDLCFQQVREAPSAPPRFHLDLSGGDRQDEVVDKLLGLGASHADIGQRNVPWVVLADPEGNPLCVMEHRDEYDGNGPVAAMPLDSADPDRDVALWAWLTGWTDVQTALPHALQHPSGRGPLLEICRQSNPPSAVKNRLHLDFRLDAGDDADEVEAGILERGGTRLNPGWGDLPWRSYDDPSGNVFCVLPVSSHA